MKDLMRVFDEKFKTCYLIFDSCAPFSKSFHDMECNAQKERKQRSKNMEERFHKAAALKKILKWEGGYSNDPDDPGGQTIFGITRRSHPNSQIWNLVDKYSESELKTKKIQDSIFELCYDNILEIYSQYIQAAEKIPVSNQDMFNGVAAFLVNAGVAHVRKLSQIHESMIKEYVVNHYNSLLVRKPRMVKFKKGFENRLKDTFNDQSIRLK